MDLKGQPEKYRYGKYKRNGKNGKYPPAEPGALNCEPLKAAVRGR